MKTLENEKISVSADCKTMTMTADIVDKPFNKLLITRVTHTHVNPDNHHHGRAVQMSNEAVFIHARQGSMAIPNDIFAKIAAAVEPLTSFPPVIKKGSLGTIKVVSEIPVTYQWQISDNAFPKGPFPLPEVVWTDIAGATSDTLDESTVEENKWVRCIVKNGAGLSVTQAAQKITKK
jgi:hypothetical protein